MPSIVNLKFKGNKSFVAFSNLSDTESLTKTWKVCTKVASYLEQGQRLENLSWRLWHLQNLMVDTDNAKSKREFKKLSKNMGDKLDKEKGRAIESLEAPDFKRNASTDLIRQRAVERERSREASQNARPGTIKRMQFTFSIDAPPGSFPATSLHPIPSLVKAPPPPSQTSGLAPSSERVAGAGENGVSSSATHDSSYEKFVASYEKLHFPPIFSTSFGPTALLYSTPTLSNPMSYGEGVSGGCATGFSIFRPTIELPLDELLGEEYDGEDDRMADAPISQPDDTKEDGNDESRGRALLGGSSAAVASPEQDVLMSDSRQQQQPQPAIPDPFPVPQVPSHTHTHTQSHPRTRGKDRSGKTPTNRPVLTVQTSATKKTKAGRRASGSVKSPSSAAPSASALKHSAAATVKHIATATVPASATATSLNPLLTLGGAAPGGKATLTAPGGVKAECSNCGATHTPLWRRGLNDELNCNACGLYCKLHKRPRPKSMRASHGEGRRGGVSSLASALSTLASIAAPPPSSAAATPVVEAVSPGVSAAAASAIANVSSGAGPSAGVNANATAASSVKVAGAGVSSSSGAGPSVTATASATITATATAGMGLGAGRGEVVEIIGSAQCYNCHTTATPLWRKDDEGKTVCNACGLYYKLHGSARPISMKSDIIRKRSRHDARAQRSSLTDTPNASNTPGTPSETPSQTQTPSASPGVSRRPTPSPSPILAPDSTTQPVASHSMSAGMGAGAGMVGTGMGGSSELMGALGDTYAVYNPFPGPYHPDYLSQNWVPPSMTGVSGGTNEALPFSGVDCVDGEAGSNASSSNASPNTNGASNVPNNNVNTTTNANLNSSTTGRTAKRRRMSTDSVSEPPSSAVSYSSYGGDSFTTGSGATSAGTTSSSRRSSMDFPFFSPYTVFRGNGNNAFWHHSSNGGADRSPQFVHPPMLPDAVGVSDGHAHGHGHGRGGHGHGMDFLHPPMMLPQEEESLFATYLHPPMILPQEGEQVQHGYEYGQGEYYETGNMQQY
ncbi:uncharacterized protein BJ212DRAFT_1485279 [Suillus subaureus]|uniref:GATA-type domain-containing protein n=1 Tax=Suillus subaureus TaxID=48587 RepID=A0A9P7J839_9AGAM|nr:uncharacterized protein BJ212DRAFT_1485279 [Suillus subaureus]KAG1807994.1 hypothetical protein BJ212DRAFT_1485279 [Suillus subaureus]